jgi:hypothetical protein
VLVEVRAYMYWSTLVPWFIYEYPVLVLVCMYQYVETYVHLARVAFLVRESSNIYFSEFKVASIAGLLQL